MEPHEQYKEVNDVATFVCKTYHPVTWTYNRGELPDIAAISGNLGQKLTIYEVSSDVVGVYECAIQDRGKFYSSMGILHLKSEFELHICLK